MALQPESIYHIFTRAVGNETLFRQEQNFLFFLRKYQNYISPVADTFAYCLLPNHFHFFLQIKPLALLEKHFKEKKGNKPFNIELVSDFIMERFSNLLNSYTKSFNKVYGRKGALFMDYLRRVELKEECQFGATIFYSHKNPVHHGYCKDISEWKWSSYASILSQAKTSLLREEVLEWFGDVTAFKKYHEQTIYLKDSLIIE